jgi:hypothetical protein
VLRTRSPRAHPLYCYRKLRVRLACVKHAASVRSEPGSNSRLKPDVTTVAAMSPYDRNELLNRSVFLPLRQAATGLLNCLLLRYTRNKRPKPNGFWHVSSDCQRAGTPRPAGRNHRQTLILSKRPFTVKQKSDFFIFPADSYNFYRSSSLRGKLSREAIRLTSPAGWRNVSPQELDHST